MSIKKGSEITLTIESAAYEGKGVGRLDGIAVFVTNTAPGDKITARITRKKKHFLEGKLLTILEPGPHRIKPKCTHAGICGGCTWQHLPYDYQLEIKQKHVADHLMHIGGFKDINVKPVIGCETPFHYRNKMEYSFGDRRWLTEKEIKAGEPIQDKNMAAGLHVPGRFDRILNLGECHLQIPISYEILNFTRSYAIMHGLEPFNPVNHTGYLRNLVIRNSYYFDDLMVNLVTFKDDESVMTGLTNVLLKKFPAITTVVNNVNDTRNPTAVGRYEKTYYGPGYIRDRIGEFHFDIHANAFFQTNTRQSERLYDVALNYAAIKSGDLVYDLYCGVGTLSLFAAAKSRQVVGIEINETAIENARQNAIQNNVGNCEFRRGDMKDIFTGDMINDFGRPEVIITDPPRSGMHPDVVQQLKHIQANRIVYVSCNSATLSRDLKILNDTYAITNIQPVDMFPQTYHIETVARLEKIV